MCIYVYICVGVSVYVCMSTCMSVCLSVCMYACACMRMYLIHTYTPAYNLPLFCKHMPTYPGIPSVTITSLRGPRHAAHHPHPSSVAGFWAMAWCKTVHTRTHTYTYVCTTHACACMLILLNTIDILLLHTMDVRVPLGQLKLLGPGSG